MVMGIITALVVVFSQVFYFQPTDYSKKETKSEQQKKQEKSSENNHSYISLPSISQSSSTHVEVDHESSFLLDILFEGKEKETRSAEVPIAFGRFFHTLFRAIISPNAP
jgi:hypothetical protein